MRTHRVLRKVAAHNVAVPFLVSASLLPALASVRLCARVRIVTLAVASAAFAGLLRLHGKLRIVRKIDALSERRRIRLATVYPPRSPIGYSLRVKSRRVLLSNSIVVKSMCTYD